MVQADSVETLSLRKVFTMGRNKIQALAGVDLVIPPGSFTVIMGPSGSGKSTLLYLIGGLDRPTSGSIRISGDDISRMDENALAVYRRKKMGFIFQQFNLVSSMTALENVAFPMRFAGVPGKQRLQRARMHDDIVVEQPKILKSALLQPPAHAGVESAAAPQIALVGEQTHAGKTLADHLRRSVLRRIVHCHDFVRRAFQTSQVFQQAFEESLLVPIDDNGEHARR